MTQANRIFIIGHSGAGKGVVAQAIAEKLNWKFINADVFGGAAHIGRKVSDIIGEEGEHKLHQCLKEILSHLTQENNIVVTTDESIICDEKTREILASEFTVYLKVSTPVQLQRISNYRPLLPVNDFGAFLDQFRHERDSLFEQVASFSLDSDDGNLEEHATQIINGFQSKKERG